MVQKEHTKGLEGDIMLLTQAAHAAYDDTHTEAGSETNAFPIYHQMREQGQVRGYDSTRIIDEKAFQHQVSTFNDQIRREVIDDDIITPMAKALFEKNAEHKKEQARKETMNMTALSEEAIKQLKEIPNYLLPRPMTTGEINSFGLSALADAVDIKALQYRRNSYKYGLLSPGQHFPASALNFAPLPGIPQGMQQGFQPGVQPGIPQGTLQGIQPSVQPSVQPIVQPSVQQVAPQVAQQRRQPPPPPAQTFIFQPPQQFFNHQQQRMPPPPQPIPVTFVNSTVSSRKAGGKGGQRILLPKV